MVVSRFAPYFVRVMCDVGFVSDIGDKVPVSTRIDRDHVSLAVKAVRANVIRKVALRVVAFAKVNCGA